MTPQSILFGICAGAISVIVFVSATAGPALSRMLFFILTPFPLYLAGLGLGFIPAMAGAAAAVLTILALTNPSVAAVFAANAAIPSVILTRLALTARGNGDQRVWYPPGRIICVAALLAAAAAAFMLVMTGADSASLSAQLKPQIADFLKSQMPGPSDGGNSLSDAQIEEIAVEIVPLIPGILAISVMLMALISLWLSGRVTLASKRLMRPWPDLSLIALPPGSALVLAAAFALTFAGGTIGPIATCFAGAFSFAFALLGLAVLHYVTRSSPWRGFLLFAVYAALLILSKQAMLVLALIGLAETVFQYRAIKPGGAPPNQTPDT